MVKCFNGEKTTSNNIQRHYTCNKHFQDDLIMCVLTSGGEARQAAAVALVGGLRGSYCDALEASLTNPLSG